MARFIAYLALLTVVTVGVSRLSNSVVVVLELKAYIFPSSKFNLIICSCANETEKQNANTMSKRNAVVFITVEN